MIRVAVIGNHAHPFCSEVHWARAFAENGCEVTPIQVDDAVAHPEMVMEILRRQTLVTYTRTHAPNRFLDVSWSDRWAELEAAGVRTVGIHLDRYFDLEREYLVTGDTPDAQFTMGTVFTADGGSQSRFEAAGVNHRWFRPGVDRVDASATSPPFQPIELRNKIVFTGSGGTYHNAYPERLDLLRFMRDRYGASFVHYGHGGDRPVVRQGDLNEVLRAAAIVLGDSCFANAPDWETKTVRYVSDRYYESPSRGAFFLAPRLPNMEEDFGLVAGRDLLTYEPGNWDHLAEMISTCADMPNTRDHIAADAQQRMLAAHTYTARMADLLAEVGLGVEESSASSGAAIR